jgi:hypothetical protein
VDYSAWICICSIQMNFTPSYANAQSAGTPKADWALDFGFQNPPRPLDLV